MDATEQREAERLAARHKAEVFKAMLLRRLAKGQAAHKAINRAYGDVEAVEALLVTEPNIIEDMIASARAASSA